MTDTTIKTLVETTLQAQIVQAFNNAPDAIDMLVKAALNQEVDQYGYKPEYHTTNKMPYLQYLVGDTIRRIARASVEQAVDARKSDIEVAVRNALTADAVVQAMIERVLGTLKEDYRLQISFKDDEDKRR